MSNEMSMIGFALLLTVYAGMLYECCKPHARPPPRTVHEILGDDGKSDDDEEDEEEEEEESENPDESHDNEEDEHAELKED
jgi:hypothetical protein